MNRVTRVWILAMVMAMALPCAAADAPEPLRTSDYLRQMDANGDGKVQLIEYQDWLSNGFDRLDRNRDGLLTPDEQPGGSGPIVTREAHRQRLAEQFRKQDRNRDGVLDAKELAAPPR